ncbi:MAG: DUF4337 domain-containing protein [Acidobacteriota bacterium]
MSVEEELHEHAEHAKAPFDKKVSATMAVLAAALAIVTVLGHMATTEEIVLQQEASDQWSYYQAKNIRRYESDIAKDLMTALQKPEKAEEYAKSSERYKKDDEDIQEKAKELETESHHKSAEATRLEYGGVFLELAIVLGAAAILAKHPMFWLISIGSGVVGAIISASVVMIK